MFWLRQRRPAPAAECLQLSSLLLLSIQCNTFQILPWKSAYSYIINTHTRTRTDHQLACVEEQPEVWLLQLATVCLIWT